MRPSRRALERVAQHDLRNDLFAFEAHLDVDARRVRAAADGPVGESRSGGHRSERGVPDRGLHQRQAVAVRGRDRAVR